jgi:uncharacterized YccA/Bax inhibitor family protein
MRTSNPVLNESVFRSPDGTFADRMFGGNAVAAPRSNVMTLNGAVMKTGILLAICTAFAIISWAWIGTSALMAFPALAGAGLLGFVLALVISFKPTAAPFLAPVYAGVEGLFVGAISVAYATRFGDQIVLNAVLLTFGTLGALLAAYSSGLIRASENFKLGVVAATGGIVLVSLLSLVLSLFGLQVPYIWGNGPIGIAVAGFIVVIAALNLVLDFDFIEDGTKAGAPKYMEWYAAFGLLVTLVWLYLSILRLLSKLNSNR